MTIEKKATTIETAACERCKKEYPKTEVEYSELYAENLCMKCRDELAAEMIECNKELATEGDL